MLNQKGQAFSVFELMIAGVVAFAILIILLTVINGIVFNPTGDAKSAIANALKSNGNSGITTTQGFEMKPGDAIVATNFQEKTSLDPQSILFCIKESSFSSATESKLEIMDSGISSVKWNGTTTLKAKAKVMCESTGEQADSTIQQLNAGSCSPSAYCEQSQPCCVVVLEKA